MLPVGQILSLYALVESSLPHKNILNSSLASDPPQGVHGELRAHPRMPKELKIMPKEIRDLLSEPQYIYKLPINHPSGRYVMTLGCVPP